MTYIIADPCVSTCDTACVEVCPVDCIFVGVKEADDVLMQRYRQLTDAENNV